MKKSLSVWCSVLLAGASQVAMAGPVDADAAIEIARDFYMSKIVSGSVMRAPVAMDFQIAFDSNDGDGVAKVKSLAAPTYYVVTPGKDLGYVVVAGDDEVTPVLGYTFEGNVNSENMPDGMKYWLECYDREIAYIRENTDPTLPNLVEQVTDVEYTQSYEPLLGAIKWNQDDPFNLKCPLQDGVRTYVGCLATAMGQIMRYHKWPETGKGSVSYITDGGLSVSADMEGFKYDWDNMLPAYTASATQVQKDAVADLLFHVGAASKMDYTTVASGATTADLTTALMNNFSYSKNLKVITRNATSYQDWVAAIQGELAARRPVYYTGIGSDGGHAFVLDGYDGQGMYHFNWGWSGVSDGYFTLSVLNPISQGIGGNTSGFNFMQEILVGLMPPTADEPEVISPNLCIVYKNTTDTREGLSSSVTEASASDLVSFYAGVLNNGIDNFEGNVILLLYNDTKQYTLYGANVQIAKGTYVGVSFPVMFGKKIADGKYQACLAYYDMSTEDGELVKMGSFYAQAPSRLNVNVDGDRITITSPGKTDFTTSDLVVPEKAYKGRQAKFSVKFKNNGNSYDSALGVVLVDKNDETKYQYKGLFKNVYIGSGDELEIEVSGRINVNPGEYYVYPLYDKNVTYETPSYAPVPGAEPATLVVEDEPADEVLSAEALSDGSRVIKTESGNGGLSEFTVRIKNEGGYYAGNIKVGIVGISSRIAAYGYAVIGEGETVDVKVAGELSLAPGKYEAVVDYEIAGISNNRYERMPGSYELEVTEYQSSSIDDAGVAAFKLYPSPVVESLNVEAESDVEKIEVYRIDGTLVYAKTVGAQVGTVDMSNVESGVYVIRIFTADDVYTQRILKK